MSVLANGETTFYHDDYLGSISHITNEYGEVEQAFRYRAFGERLFENKQNGAWLPDSLMEEKPYGFTDYGFTGRTHDTNTGLMDYRSRQYDPSIGRFIQADSYPSSIMYAAGGTSLENFNVSVPGLPTIGPGGSFDPYDASVFEAYAYVNDRPLNGTDPWGLISPDSQLGHEGEQAMMKTFRENGWYVIDPKKHVNTPGIDMLAYDPNEGVLHIVDNKESGTLNKKIYRVDGFQDEELFSKWKDSIDQLIDDSDIPASQKNKMRKAFKAGKFKLSVTTSGSNIKGIGKALREKGVNFIRGAGGKLLFCIGNYQQIVSVYKAVTLQEQFNDIMDGNSTIAGFEEQIKFLRRKNARLGTAFSVGVAGGIYNFEKVEDVIQALYDSFMAEILKNGA